MKLIRKTLLNLALILFAATLVSCSYAGVAGIGKDHVVIARNDMILFGLLRKVYVCKVSAEGLRSCAEGVAP